MVGWCDIGMSELIDMHESGERDWCKALTKACQLVSVFQQIEPDVFQHCPLFFSIARCVTVLFHVSQNCTYCRIACCVTALHVLSCHCIAPCVSIALCVIALHYVSISEMPLIHVCSGLLSCGHDRDTNCVAHFNCLCLN